MTSRCPACAAAVAPSAAWCSLCFARLRTPQAEPPHRATESAADAAGGAGAAGVARSGPAAVPAAPLAAPARTPGGTWPCRCGASVALEEPWCGDCGGGFLDDLAGAGGGSRYLPGVARIAAMGSVARAVVLGVAAFGVALAMLVLLWLAGAVL